MSSNSLNPIAEALNVAIDAAGDTVGTLLSPMGRRAYFPVRGILGQSAEARETAINATIGTALEDDGTAVNLECLQRLISIPKEAFLYAPSHGIAELRQRWREMIFEKNPSLQGSSCSVPIVTSALTHALYIVARLFVKPHDRVILPDLHWDNYEMIFEEGCGGQLKRFKTFSRNRFNLAALERQMQAQGDKKILLLNFPNNPTGYTVTEAEALAIRDILLRTAVSGKKICVIIDDAYFGLVYQEGIYRESIFVLLANLHPNLLAIKLDGPTKEDYVWGMRLGFITFGIQGGGTELYQALESKAAGLVRMTISNANNLGQRMLLQAFRHPQYELQKRAKYNMLRARYEKIQQILRAHREYRESFVAMPFNSGYFMCIRPVGVDPEVLRRALIAEHRTGTILLSGLLRLAFSSVPLERLEQLFANIDATVRCLKERG